MATKLESVIYGKDKDVNLDKFDIGKVTKAVAEDLEEFGQKMCAHGRPKTLPSGKLIGDTLGRKTPEQIFEMLTGNKDKTECVGKDYKGIVTLSGCFTASAGPEAGKQDDAFAAKVQAKKDADDANKAFDKVKKTVDNAESGYNDLKAELDKKVKDLKDSGLADTVVKITGNFGLRQIK